jgi:hypothetical protein
VKEISSAIDIDAPIERVWSVLTTVAAYPEWNPFVTSLEGEVRRGAKLRARIVPPGRKAMTFRPTVTAADAPNRFSWLGRLVLPRVFDGEHIHELEPLGDGRTRYTQREVFRGILVPFTGGVLRATEAGFRAMNEALKARAEA